MSINTVTEEWRDIPGYEGFYQVSNLGRIKSLVGWNGHKYISREKILAPTKTSTGYWKVDLSKGKARKSLKLHRAIAMAFIPNPENYPVINHLDGNRLNNEISNLEWCTVKRNCQHAYDTGLNGNKKLRGQEAEIIRRFENGESAKGIAKSLNLSFAPIGRILKDANTEYRPCTYYTDKYHIDLEELKKDLEKESSNKVLAKKYSCPPGLIGTRRYQYRKGKI